MQYLTLDWLVFTLPLVLAFALFGATMAGVDGDFEPDTEVGDMDKVLAMLGIGKIPLSLMLFVTLATFGVVGLLLKVRMPDEGASFHVCAATLVALFAGNGLSRLIAKYVPTVETYAMSKADLVGLVGVAITPIHPITGGLVSVIDKRSGRHRVSAVPVDAWLAPVGISVRLVSYDPARDVFEVLPGENQ